MALTATEKLIEAVRSNEILYNKNIDGYKTNAETNKKWGEVAAKLGLSDKEVKKKWKSLRDSYSKHLRSLYTSTGETTKLLHRYRCWPWASQMKFLRPHVEHLLPIQSNTNSVNHEDNKDQGHSIQEDSQDSRSSTESNNYNPKCTKRRKYNWGKPPTAMPPKPTSPPIPSSTEKVISFLQSRATKEKDEVDLLFLSLAKTVKRFSAQRRANIKSKLVQLVTEEELAHIQETNQQLAYHDVLQTSQF